MLHTEIEHSILHLPIEETRDGGLNGNATGFLILGKHKAEMLETARGKYPDESRFIATCHRPLLRLNFLNIEFKILYLTCGENLRPVSPVPCPKR